MPVRICYYELLGVDGRSATALELKQAYRKKALELHPDKNPTRIEEATQQFAEIQGAYEVLSDVNERAWYDSHREAILRGDDVDGEISSAVGIRIDQLMKYFSTSCYNGFTSEPDGFYSIYASLFNEILVEEREDARWNDSAFDSIPDVSFGFMSNTFDEEVYTLDKQKTSVKEFYNYMQTFSSLKSFSWMDKYNLADAPDRRIKRLMEKENKKLRDGARKEYSLTICNLVNYVKKRDLRWKQHLQGVAERKAIANIAQQQKEKIDRAKRNQTALVYIEPDWTRAEEPESNEFEKECSPRNGLEDQSTDSIPEDEENLYINEDSYCVACNKIFNTQKQLENHGNSKKHIKATQQLKREMLEDQEFLNASVNLASKESEYSMEGDASSLPEIGGLDISSDIESIEVDEKHDDSLPSISDPDFNPDIEIPVCDSDSDSNIRIQPPTEIPLTVRLPAADSSDEEVDWSSSKTNKRNKGKRAKQAKGKLKATASKLIADPIENTFCCNQCGINMKTRNKLFAHISESGHALAMPETAMKKGKRKEANSKPSNIQAI